MIINSVRLKNFKSHSDTMLEFGAGIALPIAALGLFLGMRAWSTKLSRETPDKEPGVTGPIEAANIQETGKE